MFGLKYIQTPDKLIMEYVYRRTRRRIEGALQGLSDPSPERRETIAERLRRTHAFFIRMEGMVIALLPLSYVIILSLITLQLYQMEGDWFAIRRFGVVWLIVAAYVIYLDFHERLASIYGFTFKAIHDLLPENCRHDREHELEGWRDRSFAVRRVSEGVMTTVGTFLTGYGDLL